MGNERETIITALPQIRKAITDSTGVTVRTAFPRSTADGVLITVQEITNAHSASAKVVDELGYQIDVWAFDYDTAWGLVQKVNAVMAGIGFTRSMCDRDPLNDGDGGYMRYILRYGCKVDKRTMRLIE